MTFPPFFLWCYRIEQSLQDSQDDGVDADIPFHHQTVRDLAWVMASPSLLAPDDTVYKGPKVDDPWCRSVYRDGLDWLHDLDRDPLPLQRCLDQTDSPLLGAYFEQLLGLWLDHLPETRLLARNLIVTEPGRRIGEFDLLFRDRSRDETVHWEVAVKFYLRHGQGGWRWLGPNPRDSLRRKLDKVFSRQLQLPQHPRARQLLQQRFGVNEVQSRALIKGYLFYPLDSDWRHPSATPPGVSRDHLKGWWCRQTDVPACLAQRLAAHRWVVLPRRQWLAPVIRHTEQGLMSGETLSARLADHFTHHHQAQLVVELAPSGTAWREVSRGFVVNRHWPE